MKKQLQMAMIILHLACGTPALGQDTGEPEPEAALADDDGQGPEKPPPAPAVWCDREGCSQGFGYVAKRWECITLKGHLCSIDLLVSRSSAAAGISVDLPGDYDVDLSAGVGMASDWDQAAEARGVVIIYIVAHFK